MDELDAVYGKREVPEQQVKNHVEKENSVSQCIYETSRALLFDSAVQSSGPTPKDLSFLCAALHSYMLTRDYTPLTPFDVFYNKKYK